MVRSNNKKEVTNLLQFISLLVCLFICLFFFISFLLVISCLPFTLQIGFLAEKRRMNVAVTRARRHCCIVCNGEFVAANSKFLKQMVDYFEDNGKR
jgi:superfamily I DNA and/or RNA helicase